MSTTPNFEIEIEDTSDHVKKFSVTKKAYYFSGPYIAFAIISAIFSFHLLYKNQNNSNWNDKIGILLPLVAFHLFFLFFRGNTLVKESLIVFKDIGIQIEKKYLSGKKGVEFVDVSMLKDIIIHEVNES